MKTTIIVAAVCVLAVLSASVSAGVVFTESFETPDLTCVSTNHTGIWIIQGYNGDGNTWPGWIGGGVKYAGVMDNTGTWFGGDVFINAFGDQAAFIFNGKPEEDTDASLTTTSDSLNAALTPNMTYTLSFNTASQNSASIDYHVELLAINDSDVETILSSATGTIASNDLAANSGSIVFATGETGENFGDRLAIRLRKGNGSYLYNVYYDNITLSAVPEPAAMCLLGLGGFLIRRRK